MATAYKTPGVYIEEIPKFPPSIAPVETAIPAFVGYTAKAENLAVDDLHLKPTRISSMVDYEKYFGGAQAEEAISATVDVATVNSLPTVQKAAASLAENARSKHIMYYALQLFFANGGGPCHIVSVNRYTTLPGSLVVGDLQAGLATLVKAELAAPVIVMAWGRLDVSHSHTAQRAEGKNGEDEAIFHARDHW